MDFVGLEFRFVREAVCQLDQTYIALSWEVVVMLEHTCVVKHTPGEKRLSNLVTCPVLMKGLHNIQLFWGGFSWDTHEN